MNKRNKKIAWAVVIIPLIIGLILIATSQTTHEYSTGDYWVTHDYDCVYENGSGDVVYRLGKNDKCKIKGDEIIVTETNHTMFVWGWVIVGVFGLAAFGVFLSTKD